MNAPNEPKKGRPSKNPAKKYRRVSLSLPPEVEALIREKSWASGHSMSEIVTEALRGYMQKSELKPEEVQSLKVAEDPTPYRFKKKE